MTKKQERTIILLLGALQGIGPFSTDMYLAAFPSIAADLKVSIAQVAYSMSSYFVGICLGQLLNGPLIDRFGRKVPLLLMLGVYTLASVGCTMVTSVEGLIMLRFFQAIGGSMGMVANRAIVRDVFPADRLAHVFSTMTLVMGVAPIIAPTVGGFVVVSFGWRAIFWVLAGFAFFVTLLVYFLLSESKGKDRSISLKPQAVMADFYSILRNPSFLAYTIVGAMNTAGIFTFISNAPFVYMELLGVSEQTFGWIFGLNAVFFVVGSQLNRWLLKYYSSQTVALYGLLVQAVMGVALVACVILNQLSIPILVALVGFYSLCLGMIGANAIALAIRPFTKNTGSATALMGSFQMGAGAVASAVCSYFYDGTAKPMVIVMTGVAFIGLLAIWAGSYRKPVTA
ncbi:multidrug effflux MFS transporter [Runella slithyformis]|uniref:Drug resistance transporter, Bcr/CflA subfamily n=1 Tax=Runella slithyformis (strain ATCC 29530 / DSM 19594 / LMG 11500 / NCIMB 11436 / LSU 4) TaxID=761193 RepID=A0A7U4E4D9_RUNSL|nr:multidrug effflux MFS transporter [Runella slithyformis]AEI46964.1 drug resistance transporter, Bcr/CflA subfamily [Runella slithyformis DSM 19594]